jgi:hypothetical protein
MLGAIQVTDVMQTFFPELKGVEDIEPIRTVFPELKAMQVNGIMSLGRRFPDAAETQLLASILGDDKKDAAICLCVILLDTVN